jgi:arsenite/tail-anchored protein-transporting ATPase
MQLTDNKLLMFGGKGGVGKTSCAAAASIYAASKGKKTLILSTDPAHSLGDSFDKEIGNKITNIKENLDALEIDAASLLDEYKNKYGDLIKQIADEGTFFSKEDIQEFFDLSLPGMDELMALIKIIDILEENKYDLLILDTAPTGHTIRLLEMPDLMAGYVKVLAEMRQKHYVVVKMMVGRYVKDKADEFIGKMGKDIERIKSALTDTAKTKFIPVTIPEAMSVYETERLVGVLEERKIPVGMVIINEVVNGDCSFCKARRLGQEKYILEAGKKFGKYPIKEIPLFPGEIRGKSLDILSKVLFGEKFKLPKPAIKVHDAATFDELRIKPGIKFALFGGKGGVGKTSIASAVSLHESNARKSSISEASSAGNKKVLIFSTDPANSLSDSFGVKIGDSITKINGNLDALEIDSFSLFNRLKAKYKKEIHDFFSSVFRPTAAATIDAPYDRKVMEDLFDLAPSGIDEIMGLKTMMDLMQDGKYDLFILDTAPSGHTVRLLEMPEIAEEWAKVLLDIQQKYPISFEIGDTLNEMLETIRKVREILADPERTQFIIIAIPEAMPYLETQDLLASLRRLKVPAEYLIINKIIPKSDCSFCSAKRAEQFGYIKKLQGLKLKTVGVELFENEIRVNELNKLEGALFGKSSNQ